MSVRPGRRLWARVAAAGLAAVAVLAVAGCGQMTVPPSEGVPGATDANPFGTVTYRAISGTDGGLPIRMLEEDPITVEFSSQEGPLTLFVRAECRDLEIPVSLHDGTLVPDPENSSGSAVGCIDAAATHAPLIDELTGGTISYELEKEGFTLRRAGAVILFERGAAASAGPAAPGATAAAPPLSGVEDNTFWSTGGAEKGVELAWLREAAVRVTFSSSGGAVGMSLSTPCNGLGEDVDIDPGTNSITPHVETLVTTDKLCIGPKADHERWVSDFIKRPMSAVLTGDELVVHSGDEILRFALIQHGGPSR